MSTRLRTTLDGLEGLTNSGGNFEDFFVAELFDEVLLLHDIIHGDGDSAISSIRGASVSTMLNLELIDSATQESYLWENIL